MGSTSILVYSSTVEVYILEVLWLGEVVRKRLRCELFCIQLVAVYGSGYLLERPRRVILFCNDFSENVPHSDHMQAAWYAGSNTRHVHVLRARTQQRTVQQSSCCTTLLLLCVCVVTF